MDTHLSNTPPIFPTHHTCIKCRLNAFEATPGSKEIICNPSLRNPGLPTLYLRNSLSPSPTTPAIVFVGRNPTAHEDNTGEVYTGLSGLILRGDSTRKGTYIDGINLRSRASIYLTNICRCASFDDADVPKDKELTACLPYLLTDLSTIRAAHNGNGTKLILCTLGAEAAGQFTKLTIGRKHSMNECFALSATKWEIPTSPPSNWTFFSFWQPAYLDLNKRLIHSLSDHLQILSDFLDDLLPPITQPNIVAPFPPPSF